MISLKTPRGLPVQVPESLAEDVSPRFDVGDAEGFVRYYRDNGYVIVRDLITAGQCEKIRALWEAEVKPFGGYMYRQATARAERHQKNRNGWIMNPILNLQSVDPRHFPGFRDYASNSILSDGRLHRSLTALLGGHPKVVQSMYFEGNSATWEHQDSYYLDSEAVGEMAGAWIAVEDISASAGRFFICPGSHKIELAEHNIYNNIAENHERYIASVVDRIRLENLEIRAPILFQGDVLFWNSWTIHGSLDSQDARHSRSSITCHAIPQSRRFLQLQTRVLDLKTDDVNGTRIYRPKDLASARNRLVLGVESHFPKPFYWLKKQAILLALRNKRNHVSRPAQPA